MKNVVKIDEKNFKITDDSSSSRQEVVFAATKKATPKRAGKAVVITDIYKDSDGLIVIALDELQVDGASYATAANACVALNGFIGSFSAGGGGSGVSPKIPAGTVSMSDYMNAETVVVEDWMTAIPDYMFQNRNFLKKIIGGGNVTSIGQYAFSGCTALADLGELGKSVTSIGQYVFNNCTSITNVNFPNLVTMPAYAFLGSFITKLTIGNAALSINFQSNILGSSGWSNQSLKTLTIGFSIISTWGSPNANSGTACNLVSLTDLVFSAPTVTVPATGIGFYNCKQINQASAVNLFNKLVDNTGKTVIPLYFSPEVIARLSQTDKDIALNKNYTINTCAA